MNFVLNLHAWDVFGLDGTLINLYQYIQTIYESSKILKGLFLILFFFSLVGQGIYIKVVNFLLFSSLLSQRVSSGLQTVQGTDLVGSVQRYKLLCFHIILILLIFNQFLLFILKIKFKEQVLYFVCILGELHSHSCTCICPFF